MKKIVIIGGGAAGAKAASKAKRLNPNNIVQLFTDYDKVAFSLCGLPYYIKGSIPDINKLIVRTPDEFRQKGIEIFLNHKLEEIYPQENSVLINKEIVQYDELILSLGANAFLPNIENINLNNVFTLRSLESAQKIREKMLVSKKALILGAGLIAIELLEAFIHNGLEVTIVEDKKHIAQAFDEDFADLIKEIILKQTNSKVSIYCGEKVIKFEKNGNDFKSAISETGKEFEADFCVIAAGARPNIEVARKAGIILGVSGAIYVDSKMRTNYSNIFACGDCTQKHCIITRQPTYLGLGTIANKEGRVAAINAVNFGESENFDGVLDSTITKFFEYSFSKTGLTMAKALQYSKNINIEPISATVTKKDKASYMPNASEVTIKLIADKRNGEILGAQGLGLSSTVIQRINIITSALKKRTTIEDLLHLDLAYAPPFSSSIDPILTAAYKLKELLKK